MSVEAQLFSIEQTFAASTDISGLKHPNKKDVEAVEVYDFLPDSDLWPNTYDLIRFSERPGERPLDVCIALVISFLDAFLIVL